MFIQPKITNFEPTMMNFIEDVMVKVVLVGILKHLYLKSPEFELESFPILILNYKCRIERWIIKCSNIYLYRR